MWILIVLAIIVVAIIGFRIYYQENVDKPGDDEFRKTISEFFTGDPRRLSMLEAMEKQQEKNIEMLKQVATTTSHFAHIDRLKRNLRILQEEIETEKQKPTDAADKKLAEQKLAEEKKQIKEQALKELDIFTKYLLTRQESLLGDWDTNWIFEMVDAAKEKINSGEFSNHYLTYGKTFGTTVEIELYVLIGGAFKLHDDKTSKGIVSIIENQLEEMGYTESIQHV